MSQVAYLYQAEHICATCAGRIKKELKRDGKAPTNPRDEHSFDSDDYPKGPYENGGGEADCYQHCGICKTFLENPLTEDGVKYTINAFCDHVANQSGNGEVLDLWAEDLRDYQLSADQKKILDTFVDLRKKAVV